MQDFNSLAYIVEVWGDFVMWVKGGVLFKDSASRLESKT